MLKSFPKQKKRMLFFSKLDSSKIQKVFQKENQSTQSANPKELLP